MSIFKFREFQIQQTYSALKVGTDSMLLGAFIKTEHELKALDIGSGTGVLSMMVAQKNNKVQIDAIEIDAEALKDLTENFKNAPWSNRLNIFHGDFLEHDFQDKQYDLIFSNPPFYENGMLSGDLFKDRSKHELAMPLENLFQKVNTLLSGNGHFWVIMPSENHLKWIEYAVNIGLFCEGCINLYAKPSICKRVILTFSKVKSNMKRIEFIIRNENGNYSEEYKLLTKGFHSKEPR